MKFFLASLRIYCFCCYKPYKTNTFEGKMTGYEKSPDYGSKPPTGRSIIVSVCVMMLIAAALIQSSKSKEAPSSTSFDGTVEKIVDADTWYMSGQLIRVRAWGYNGTDDKSSDEYRSGKEAISTLILNKHLTCERKGTSFERPVGHCVLDDGRDVGCEMIKTGLVEESVKHSKGFYAECTK